MFSKVGGEERRDREISCNLERSALTLGF